MIFILQIYMGSLNQMSGNPAKSFFEKAAFH
jgi:hypothetical protein